MNNRAFTTWALLTLTMIGVVLPVGVCAQENRDCSIIAGDLSRGIDKLKDRVSELNVAHQNRNLSVIQEILNDIATIVGEIRLQEQRLAACQHKTRIPGPVMEPVKSYDAEFATLGCDDLRKRYVQVSRRLNALRRQLESTSTETNPEQIRESRRSEESLKSIKKELSARCLPQRKPTWPPKGQGRGAR